jgi:protein TonB
MDLSVTSSTLGWLTLLLVLGVVGIVYGLKYLMSKRGSEILSTGAPAGESALKARSKYPEVDVFRLSNTFLYFGTAASIALVVLAFSWTTYEDRVLIPDGALDFDQDIEIEPPRTAEPPPPPPPPPPPVIEEVPDEEILDDEPEFLDQTVDETTVIEDAPKADNTPPPPPPPPPAPKVEDIFKVVEDMPRFPGCEDISGKTEREQCAQQKMLEFIYKNIKYPTIARENGVEGTAVIRFVVEPDGSITNAEVVRDIGAGCGAEALRVVQTMPKWVPGKQRGKAVRVQFNLPVKFKLE